MRRAVLKFTWVEAKLFVREPLTVAFSMAFPIILLFVLAEVFQNDSDPTVYRGKGPIDFYLPAYIGLATAAVGFIGIPTHLSSYRETGVLRRLQASALPAWHIFGAQFAVAFGLSIASGGAMVLFVLLVYEPSMPVEVWGVVMGYILGTASLAGIGLFLGAVLPSSRTAQLAGMILFFVMMIISGPGPPREILPTVLQRTSDAMPLTHIIKLIQDPWLGFGWNFTEMGIVVGMLAASVALAMRFFRWE